MRTHRRPALAVAACLIAGCGAEPAPEGTVAVTMYDNGYSPPRVRVPVGGRVIFRNAGRNQHHAVALDESWSTEESVGTLVMEPGDSAEVTFDEPGVYPYYCTYHGSPLGDRGMVGRVLVGDVEDAPPGGARPEPVARASGRVLRVPQDRPRIQAAVDAARPGDLVLVDRGVWREEVRITTPSIVLRGVDRNQSVLDGGQLFGSGVLVLADGVAVENLTARNYLLNGFYWTGATGFRGSNLTAHDNGDYGIYAFDSTDGLIESSWASGSPDGGIYVGQCHPCRTVIRHVISEGNGLGYSGTNAGGDLHIVSSVFRRNMAGIVPNTLDTELLPPQREAAIVANWVLDNDNLEAPGKGIVWPAFGSGILVAGGRGNRIERNVVAGHDGYGILLLPSSDERFWPVLRNRVKDNVVSGSGRADLAVGFPGAAGNCFAGNRFGAAAPPGLQAMAGCDGLRLAAAFDAVPAVAALLRQRQAARDAHPRGELGAGPPPPPQPQLPGGAGAPVRPAVDVFARQVRPLAEARLPSAAPARAEPAARGPRRRPPARLAAAAAWMPLALWALWTAAAAVDLAARPEMAPRRRRVWLTMVVVLPGLGAGAYLAAGPARLGAAFRALLVAGGVLLWAAAVAAAVAAGWPA